MVAKIMAVIGGAFVGFVVSLPIRFVVIALIPEEVRATGSQGVSQVGAAVNLVCMAVGAWIFYQRFVRSRS